MSLYVWLGLFAYHFFLKQASLMGHFKQLTLDYMDIVISESSSSVGLSRRRFFMFPFCICLCGQVFAGGSCVLWG